MQGKGRIPKSGPYNAGVAESPEVKAISLPIVSPQIFAKNFARPVDGKGPLNRVVVNDFAEDIQSVGADGAGEENLPYVKKPGRFKNVEGTGNVGLEGCWRIGVMNVLSTTSSAPWSCARRAAPSRSPTTSVGLPGVSM